MPDELGHDDAYAEVGALIFFRFSDDYRLYVGIVTEVNDGLGAERWQEIHTGSEFTSLDASERRILRRQHAGYVTDLDKAIAALRRRRARAFRSLETARKFLLRFTFSEETMSERDTRIFLDAAASFANEEG